MRFSGALDRAMRCNRLREALAAVQHEIWAHWMRYQLSVCRDHSVGTAESVVIPPDKLERWRRQMETPYAELSDAEKVSDREQADKILAVLRRLWGGEA